MSDRNDGGPAFPCPQVAAWDGMSLRDWFAGQVMAKMIDLCTEAHTTDNVAVTAAIMAYRLADAMLAERSK